MSGTSRLSGEQPLSSNSKNSKQSDGEPELPATLRQAREFHGHLGPYLVAGLKVGAYVMERLSAQRYFGLQLTVYGPPQPPPSCILDGLQLATGCTFGKRNLELVGVETPDSPIQVEVTRVDTGQQLKVELQLEVCRYFENLLKEQGEVVASLWVWEQPAENLLRSVK